MPSKHARPLFLVLMAAAVVALVLVVTKVIRPGTPALFGKTSTEAAAIRTVPELPVPEPQIVKPLTEEQAMAANLAAPLVQNALEPAASFRADTTLADAVKYRTALDCLTAALYYEASGEGVKGQRAVAQVVLNRVKHPAFPASVCDVVYQGSQRQTGCQFTFTCDGSLERRPARAGWDRARRVAEDALGGFVDASVGMATHYHANWVVPYWAESLDKIAVVGAHVFYRWRGYWGRRDAFTQTYSEGETSETLISLPEETQTPPAQEARISLSTNPALSHLQISLPEAPSVRPLEDEVDPLLRADEATPDLIVDRRNLPPDQSSDTP